MFEYCAPSTNGQARQEKLQKATNTNWFALAAVVNKPHAFLEQELGPRHLQSTL